MSLFFVSLVFWIHTDIGHLLLTFFVLLGEFTCLNFRLYIQYLIQRLLSSVIRLLATPMVLRLTFENLMKSFIKCIELKLFSNVMHSGFEIALICWTA